MSELNQSVLRELATSARTDIIAVPEEGQRIESVINSDTVGLTNGMVMSDDGEEVASGIIGNGQITKSTDNLFPSGSISLSQLNSTFGGSKMSQLYRGGSGVPDCQYNNSVPTSGTIKFSDFRGTTKKIYAQCNGNFNHLQARWEIFGDQDWTSAADKRITFTGHCGSSDANPGMRINNSGALYGNTVEMTTAGSPAIIGKGGNAGSGGNIGMHIATPIKIPDGFWNGSVYGGGGGGGTGGNGGNGGNGQHGGKKRCNGWFCNGSKRECNGDGGSGGNGGNGGSGGTGAGYVWTGSAWNNSQTGGSGGNAGNSGNGRAGNGGNGGNGGGGGGYGGTGGSGNSGNKGNRGGNGESGCGGGPNNGNNGNGGNGGAGGGAKSNFSHNGYRYS
jgi:hypothetical protein